MFRAAVLSTLLALATAQYNDCPEPEGLQLYPHPTSCNEFYKCANGSLTHEVCENGLLFDGKGGAVHNHCNYHWAVDCGEREADLTPLGKGICEYSFGIYSNGPCEIDYTLCVYGEPKYEPCTPGLAYDERIHGCNWPDLLEYCNPQALASKHYWQPTKQDRVSSFALTSFSITEIVGFQCPAYVDSKDPAARFLPHPRYPTSDCGRYIVCVEGNPRLVGCGDYAVFNPNTLTCEEPDLVPQCANYFKK